MVTEIISELWRWAPASGPVSLSMIKYGRSFLSQFLCHISTETASVPYEEY